MVDTDDMQVNLAKTKLLENANQGDLGVLEIRPTTRVKAHENSVDAITVDPTSDKLFATGSHDKTIKLWDATKPQKALNVLTGNKQGVWCLNYAHDGKRLVSASSDGLCKIWDVKTGKVAAELTAHQGAKAYFATWNADSTMVATCGSDQLICLYDTRKPTAPLFKNQESESVVISCDFTNDQ